MYELLTNMGVQPLVANFILFPEWLHVGSAFMFIILFIGVAYLLRIDLDPIIFGQRQSMNAIFERIIFYPILIAVLLWTYYYEWTWPDKPIQGFYWNKFTIGGVLIYALILGRGLFHFIYTEKDRREFFDQFPFYLMIEFQFAVPLVYYYQLERNGLMPKEELGFALACVFIGYFVIRLLLGLPTHFLRNPITPWLCLFIAYVLLTVIIFPFRLAAIKNIIQWIAFAVCFLVTLAYIPDRRRRDAVLITAIIASLVSTLWGFWKYFDLPNTLFGLSNGKYPDDFEIVEFRGVPYFYKTPSAGRYFLLAGFFANPNYYGEYLAMIIFISLGLLLSTSSRKLRTFLAISLAINCFEMVALYNRAGWLGMFVATGFVLIGTAWARLPIFKQISRTAFAGGIAALILILLLTGVIFNKREQYDDTPLAGTPLDRLKSMTDFKEDETFRNRLTMWRAAKIMLTDPEAFPQRLIFGGGFGFFEVNYLPYQTKVLETYDFNEWFHNVIPTFRAHNDHLQMLVESGIIGTSLYALIFIMFFAYGFRFLREEPDAGKRFYALGILASTACLIAIAFFSFPLHQIQHGGLLFTAMAALVSEIAQSRRKRAEPAQIAALALSGSNETVGKKKKTKKNVPLPEPENKIDTYPPEYFITLKCNLHPALSALLISITIFLTTWGVYTQVINFKSQYYVVKGIATLRTLDSYQTEHQRQNYAQIAADFFWRAYQLDPTNGRAEFFHGFALTKKNTYEDTVSGIEHLEEGQLLYPQSDTHYALAMGYEARRRLAFEKAQAINAQISSLMEQLKSKPEGEDRENIQKQIDELKDQKEFFENDSLYSMNKAIQAYQTAAEYYPVKIEYYKELIRLLEEQKRYDEMIKWAERGLVVDAWLKKKPPIRWQLYLWLGKAHRALGAKAISENDIESGLERWQKAEQALQSCKEIAPGVYYAFYELAQIYEALGDIALGNGDKNKAMEQYSKARDMYVEVFKRKDRVPSGQAPFDYAWFLLGRIYEKLGDSQKAINYYKDLIKLSHYSKDTETYQKARQRIQSLSGEIFGEPPSSEVHSTPDLDEPSY